MNPKANLTTIYIIVLIAITILISLLIISIALFSNINAHPDEFVHLYAGEYYFGEWLPPKIDDPGIAHTYSNYGRSRLNSLGLDYLFAGKIGNLLYELGLTKIQALRIFSSILFISLISWLIYSKERRILVMLLLVTPQVWYISSYLNDDILPFIISFILIQIIFSKDGLYQNCKYLINPLNGILLGLLLGIFLLSKQNYLPLSISLSFFVICCILKCIKKEKKFLLPILPILVVAFIISGRFWIDLSTNGIQKQNKIEYAREKFAQYEYKYSTFKENPEESYNGLWLKEKGFSLTDILLDKNWIILSLKSFFGVYGYMNIFADNLIYSFFITTFSSLIIGLILESKNNKQLKTLITLFFLFCVITIFASAYNSWINDLQPQGRYLFPILPALSIIFTLHPKIINNIMIKISILFLLSLSLFSYISIAIPAFL